MMSTFVTDLVDEQIAPPFQLLDLPDDVLAIVVAAGLSSPTDVASVAATSRRLYRICKRAPFRLQVNQMLRSTTSFSASSTTTQEDAQAYLHEILAALCQSFPGTTELNLASLPLGNEGVVLVQKYLPSLTFLNLSGCKKLTSDAVLAATSSASASCTNAVANAAATAAASALRCIDLQRCYQLTAEDLSTLIHASTRPGSKLSCVALSHLDLSSWTLLSNKKPFSFLSTVLSSLHLSPSPSMSVSSFKSTLRMLALHNGIKLTASGLRSIVSACPLLQVLCFGGSVLELDVSSHIQSSTSGGSAGAAGDERAHSSGGSSPTAAAAAAAPAAGQNINTNNNNNNNHNLSTSPRTPTHYNGHPLNNSQLSSSSALQDDQAEEYSNTFSHTADDPLVSQLLQQAGDCGISPVLLASSHGIWLKNSAAQLAAAVCRLPNLRILELTHCAPGLTLLVTRILEAASGLPSNGYPSIVDCTGINGKNNTLNNNRNNKFNSSPPAERVQVWDMTTNTSVSAALHWRTTCSLPSSPPLPRSDVEMMLTAMVRCSSPGRITSLHSAAEDGDVTLLTKLLFLGAEVDARDRGGASALFCACESGHADAVETLLEAGASATLRNAAGEAPLYIAALRGHERVVEVLLRYCAEKGIKWKDQRLYADGWTPLHAAAVSGRLSIAGILLNTAGAADAAALVTAINRYGQTCVHVAARKGTPALVQLLIEAGGSASLSVADCDGRTAADVARRNGNSSAWRLLTGTMSTKSRNHQLQRATTPTVEKKVRQQPAAQHSGNRWVGRRLQQRKAQSPQ